MYPNATEAHLMSCFTHTFSEGFWRLTHVMLPIAGTRV